MDNLFTLNETRSRCPGVQPFKEFWKEDGFEMEEMRVFGMGPDGPYAASPV